MPFALVVIGVLLFVTAINNTWRQFGAQFYSDMFGPKGGFIYWVAALVVVGLLGYIPQFKKPSDAFMVLIIIGLLLHNGGFFTALQQGLAAGPSGGTNPSTGSAQAATSLTNIAPSSNLGLTLGQFGVPGFSNATPLTTPAPIAGGTPLGYGGIGSA
jgi:di/tricarboxylate transporter